MDKKLEGTIWDGVDIPPFKDFLRDLDDKLMAEIENDPTGAWSAMFEFFDSDSDNPLTPRELLQFWQCLSEEERLFFMLEFC